MQQHLDLNTFRNELDSELSAILEYWITYAQDDKNGGFVGKIDNLNNVDYSAPKGSVLHARVLWSFSAAAIQNHDARYLEAADRAFQYINTYFIDKEFGGVYWTITANGQPLDTKKQVYAIAFTIYALSEFYQAVKKEDAKDLAIGLYKLLVEKTYDSKQTGYFEAFTRDWKEIADLRLSAKDANEKKTMNTHLHVLEAYSNLYKIWKNDELNQQIKSLIHNFTDHIIAQESNHLVLFFDENWVRKSGTISYGHDIEAAWLLLEAAETIEDEHLISKLKDVSTKLANSAIKGLAIDGSLYYEFEPSQQHTIKEKHWWVQAEALVGFFNAWQISREQHYLEKCKEVWNFIKQHIIDNENGEWFWGVLEDGTIMPHEDKAGLWKCPYHNSRACLELIRRISNTLNKHQQNA